MIVHECYHSIYISYALALFYLLAQSGFCISHWISHGFCFLSLAAVLSGAVGLMTITRAL